MLNQFYDEFQPPRFESPKQDEKKAQDEPLSLRELAESPLTTDQNKALRWCLEVLEIDPTNGEAQAVIKMYPEKAS